MLETLPRTGDDEDASTERRLLRCAACGTHHASSHYVLENEFMCPSFDEETIRRLSIDAALARLNEHGELALAARRAELVGCKQAALAELAEMLVERRRAPNWHIQRHAIECLLDAGYRTQHASRSYSPIPIRSCAPRRQMTHIERSV